MAVPPALEKATRKNLPTPIQELFSNGTVLSVTDPALGKKDILIKVYFEDATQN